MIVFLNPLNRTITICDKIVQVYPWYKIAEISKILKDKDVMYVSEIIEVTGDEVINIIEEENDKDYSSLGDQTSISEGELYIHAKTKGKYSAVYQGKNYMFNGLYDIKPISSLPEGMLEKCDFIVHCLKNGTMEIINEQEKDDIIQKYEQDIIEAKDSINKMQEKIKGSVEDPIEIDISSQGSFRKGSK